MSASAGATTLAPLAIDLPSIDAIVDRLDVMGCPGGAIGVAAAGRTVFRRGFGLRSLDGEQKVTPRTRLRIASISKHVTCLAFLLLCEDGLADIDAPIGRYLLDLAAPLRDATIRQLMAHTSGIQDAHDAIWNLSGTGIGLTSGQILDQYRMLSGRDGAPGSAWRYSNGGYLLISAAIEQISGRSLEAFLKDRIFDPIGMRDTVLRRSDFDFLANSAQLHMRHGDGPFDRSCLGTEWAGEAGIVSSIDEMLLWMRHMDAPVVGRAESWAALRTTQSLVGGEGTGYTLGLLADEYAGHRTLWHPGGVMGGGAAMMKFPDAGLDIIVAVNREDLDATAIAHDVAGCCLPLAERKHVSGRTLDGVYLSNTGPTVVRCRSTGESQFVSVNGFELRFDWVAEDRLLPAPQWRFFAQEIQLLGPGEIRFVERGRAEHLIAAPEEAHDAALPAGRFGCAMASAEALLSGSRDSPTMRVCGPYGSVLYSLEHLTGRHWRAFLPTEPRWGGILAFDGLQRFSFTTMGNAALPFMRCD